MADGDFFIGQPEVLLGIMPGGGGTPRLTRLIGTHRSLVAILEGKPFTPAEALANGAVDEVVPPDEVVARATELAEHFGSRSKGSVAAIKKAVYFGGSKSLSEGLHIERTEFLMADQSKGGQELMLDYVETTDATGQLPLYNPDTYARVVDGIAARHRVITFDNRGVGASTGKTPDTIQAMAKDAVAFIRALGFDQVDLHGFSMGGMIAQVIAQDEPELVRKLILTGTGPAGGKGMKEVVWVAQLDTLRGL